MAKPTLKNDGRIRYTHVPNGNCAAAEKFNSVCCIEYHFTRRQLDLIDQILGAAPR